MLTIFGNKVVPLDREADTIPTDDRDRVRVLEDRVMNRVSGRVSVSNAASE